MPALRRCPSSHFRRSSREFAFLPDFRPFGAFSAEVACKSHAEDPLVAVALNDDSGANDAAAAANDAADAANDAAAANDRDDAARLRRSPRRLS